MTGNQHTAGTLPLLSDGRPAAESEHLCIQSAFVSVETSHHIKARVVLSHGSKTRGLTLGSRER